MRPVNADSAAFPAGGAWDRIDWPTVHRRVRGLQIRIAKATREQDWRRVKALQRFLVNSYSAKAMAVKRVSENDGKRTPGVDGEIWTTPEAKWRAIPRLNSRGLRPQPGAAGQLEENRYITRAGVVDVRSVDPIRLRVSYRVVGNSAITISSTKKFLYSGN